MTEEEIPPSTDPPHKGTFAVYTMDGLKRFVSTSEWEEYANPNQ